MPTEMVERMNALAREVPELRQANEILRKIFAYFAQADLGRRFRSDDLYEFVRGELRR